MNPVLKIKKLRDDIDNLGYAKPGDAAIDLRASGRWIVDLDENKKEIEQESYELKPMERIYIKTGMEFEIPAGFWGSIRDRSGLALKHGLHTLGGVVDETFRGELGVIFMNLGKNPYVIKKNERIAQMIICPYAAVDIVYQKELSQTHRGKDGFGSTGKH